MLKIDRTETEHFRYASKTPLIKTTMNLKIKKMRTVKLKTGVEVTFDERDNMVIVCSPYENTEPEKVTVLRYYVNQIKKIIQ